MKSIRDMKERYVIHKAQEAEVKTRTVNAFSMREEPLLV